MLTDALTQESFKPSVPVAHRPEGNVKDRRLF